ncbi:MAG: sugar phosphate nucleotidyltransferase, partial [Deltaproteobacteria bacterium]
MKAIILPTTNTGNLSPLTSWTPEFLLPVVNKPIVEHLVELLARHHIEEILLIIKHMPYETEKYFGDGSRWGVRLSYSLLRNYRGITDALSRIEASKLEGPFLSLPAD